MLGKAPRGGARNDDHVESSEVTLALAKALANQALEAISIDRVPNMFLGHRHTKAGGRDPIWTRDDQHMPI